MEDIRSTKINRQELLMLAKIPSFKSLNPAADNMELVFKYVK